MIDLNARNPLQAQELRSSKTTVTGKYRPVLIDDDRADKPKLANARGDLLDLLSRMLSGIAGIGPQILDPDLLDDLRRGVATQVSINMGCDGFKVVAVMAFVRSIRASRP